MTSYAGLLQGTDRGLKVRYGHGLLSLDVRLRRFQVLGWGEASSSHISHRYISLLSLSIRDTYDGILRSAYGQADISIRIVVSGMRFSSRQGHDCWSDGQVCRRMHHRREESPPYGDLTRSIAVTQAPTGALVG